MRFRIRAEAIEAGNPASHHARKLSRPRPTGIVMQTPGISHVTGRIREIQSRVERPAPPGHFQAMLDQELSHNGRAADHRNDTDGGPGRSRGVAMSAWQSIPPTTRGVMVGIAAPSVDSAVLPPFPGIASRGELETYLRVHGIEARNGRLTDGDLTAVSGGWNGSAELLPPAASAWEEMRAAAATAGIDLMVIDSYRTWESQARAYAAHLRGEKKANVLAPGHSEHGNGLAVDVTNGSIIGNDDAEWRWLEANASRFGWYPISNETWHWEFRGTAA